MLSADEQFGYSSILLGVAPMASQLAQAPIYWILIFPFVAIPILSLLLPLGHLSACSPLNTYKNIVPIASGIGWALTWLVGERLYVEGLRAAQNLLYIIFSIRPSLDWAISCGHTFNSEHCVNFDTENVTVSAYKHYPDNFWPAQEFNRMIIRGNDEPLNISTAWEPNEWYLGQSTDQFFFAVPTLGLLMSHTVIWMSIYFCCLKLLQGSQQWFVRIFVYFPAMLYVILMMGMSVCGLHFSGEEMQVDIDELERDKDPYDFWTDVRGLYRTSILMVDYSAAFTGIILFATSRVKIGNSQLNPYGMVGVMMIVPTMLTILRRGCEGHIHDQQPAYRTYISTDETMSFDVLPVCFATSHLGPLWSTIYFTAQFLYSSLGPMILFTSFIYQTFVDDFPTIQNKSKLFFSVLVCFFATPSFLLYMPLGTKITLLFRYVSQQSIIQILAYVVIFFVYGWQTIESDFITATYEAASVSLTSYLIRPTSPIITFLLFSIVPALLCTKFVAVFDLLVTGNDIMKHIDIGVSFIPFSLILRRLVGYGIMFAPIFIVTAYASKTMYNMIVVHNLPVSDLFRPTAQWMQHTTLNNARPRPHSLCYGVYNSLLHNISYETSAFILFVIECFIGIILIVLFLLNSLSVLGFQSSSSANDYRSMMLLTFVLLHILSLYHMRQSQRSSDTPERLSLYIGVATMECAMLNGYMWMFAADHSWGFDFPPLFLIFTNTMFRGACISLAIAIRHHLMEMARPPTRTRDATEIYEVDTIGDPDPEDDSPIIFDLARA